MPKKNSQDDTEIQSYDILRQAFLDKKIRFEEIGGKKEAIDGYLYFYDEEHRGLTKLDKNDEWKAIPSVHCQVKGTVQDITYYPCSIDFLTYCFYSIEPVFLIFVKVLTKKIYFKAITKDFIQGVLGIEDLDKHPHESKSVSFDESDVFTGNSDQLLEVFLENSINFKKQPKESIVAATATELEVHGDEISKLLSGDKEKVLELEGLIFSQSPLDIKNISSIRDKMKLTNEEINFYIEKLVGEKILTLKSDILSVTDTKIGKGLMEDIINRMGVEYIYG